MVFPLACRAAVKLQSWEVGLAVRKKYEKEKTDNNCKTVRHERRFQRRACLTTHFRLRQYIRRCLSIHWSFSELQKHREKQRVGHYHTAYKVYIGYCRHLQMQLWLNNEQGHIELMQFPIFILLCFFFIESPFRKQAPCSLFPVLNQGDKFELFSTVLLACTVCTVYEIAKSLTLI